MAIDFTLTAQQRDLQLRSRKFAKEVLSPAIGHEHVYHRPAQIHPQRLSQLRQPAPGATSEQPGPG
jgi:hypothetical protein